MNKKGEESSSSIYDTFIIPDKNAFEVSYWFQNTKSQIRHLENIIDKKNRNTSRKKDVGIQDSISSIDSVLKSPETPKNKEKLSNYWRILMKKILNLRTKKRLQKGKSKLDEQKNKRKQNKRKLKNYPPQEIISQTSSGFREEVIKQQEEEETEVESPFTEKYRKIWISLIKRFYKQTKYNTLIQEQEKLVIQRKREKIERQERFAEWTKKLLHNDQIQELETFKERLYKASDDWNKLITKLYLQNQINAIKDEYDKWRNLRFQNPDQITDVWKLYSSYLLKNHYRLKSVREFFAMERLTRFFQYIIIPRRAMHVVDTMELPWRALVKRETKKEIARSARKIRRCSLHYRASFADNFAINFTEAIAEAFSAVAINHLGPPTKLKQKPPKSIKQKPHVKMPVRPIKQKKPDTRRKVDAATMPREEKNRKDDIFIEEDQFSDDELDLGEIVEHSSINIEIDNNSESALPPNIQIVQIMHEEPSSPPKTDFPKIEINSETSTKNNSEISNKTSPETSKSPSVDSKSSNDGKINNNYLLSTGNKEQPRLEFTKNPSASIPPRSNAGIQTNPSQKKEITKASQETQKSTSSGKSSSTKPYSEGLSDINLSAPSISRIMEMYGSGSSLEEINVSVEEIPSELELTNSGSPIKTKSGKSTNYEEESYQTETPASMSSAIRNNSPRNRFSSPFTSSSFMQTPHGGLSNQTERIDLLMQHNAISSEPVPERHPFVPYRIDEEISDYSENVKEDEEESFAVFDFAEEEEEFHEYEEEEEEQQSDVPFIFSDAGKSDEPIQLSNASQTTPDKKQEQKQKFSSSEPKFVFSSTEALPLSKKSDGPNFVFLSNENISIPSKVNQQQQQQQQEEPDSIPEKESPESDKSSPAEKDSSFTPKRTSDSEKSPVFNFSTDNDEGDKALTETPKPDTSHEYTYSYYSPDIRPTPSGSDITDENANITSDPENHENQQIEKHEEDKQHHEEEETIHEEEENVNETTNDKNETINEKEPIHHEEEESVKGEIIHEKEPIHEEEENVNETIDNKDETIHEEEEDIHEKEAINEEEAVNENIADEEESVNEKAIDEEEAINENLHEEEEIVNEDDNQYIDDEQQRYEDEDQVPEHDDVQGEEEEFIENPEEEEFEEHYNEILDGVRGEEEEDVNYPGYEDDGATYADGNEPEFAFEEEDFANGEEDLNFNFEEEDTYRDHLSLGVSSDYQNPNDSKMSDDDVPNFNFGNEKPDSSNESITLESMSPARPLNSSTDKLGLSPGGFFLTGL